MRGFFLLAELLILLFFAYLVYLWWVSKREQWKQAGREAGAKDTEIQELKARLDRVEKK